MRVYTNSDGKVVLSDGKAIQVPLKRNEWGNTGSVDAEGLRELGWNQNDIDWLQRVCWWDEEDNEKWKVTDANKAFGPNGATPITENNYTQYYTDENLIYFPKLSIMPKLPEGTSCVVAIPSDGINSVISNNYVNNYQLRSIGDLSGKQVNVVNFISSTGIRSIGDGSILISGSIGNIFNSSEITKVNVSGFKGVTRFYFTFSSSRISEFIGIEDFDASELTDLMGSFSSLAYLEKLDLSRWDVSKVNSINSSFQHMKKLKDASWFGQWNLKDGIDMRGGPFRGCRFSVFALPDLKPNTLVDQYVFIELTKLRHITSCGKISVSIGFTYSSLLTRESCLNLINGLDAEHPGTLSLHRDAKQRLTVEDIAIATSKGWTIA